MSRIRQQYNDIASIYDHLSEGDDGALYFRMNVEKILKKLIKGAAVLDCSCGTGDHAIWVARQGCKVYASDISENMLEKAREKARLAKVNMHFFRSSWKDLSENSGMQYQLVMSPGNSFSHLEGTDMLGQSLNGIFRSLKDGGTFCFDIRNWEKTFAENNLKPQEFETGKKGSEMRVRYTWDLTGWNMLSKMHVDTLSIKTSEYKKYVFDFFPLGYEQLKTALHGSGFTSVKRNFYPDTNYYFVRALKK